MKRRLRVCWLGALLGCVFAPSVFSQECLELVGRWPYGPASAVAVSGDLAIFAGGPSLMVADVSDPTSPRVVSELLIDDRITDMAVDGSYAYLLSDQRSLTVIDFRVPVAPVKMAVYETSLDLWHLDVANGYIAVTMGDAGLLIIDVATPSMPVEVGIFEEEVSDVAVQWPYVYTVGDRRLRVIDISVPSSPIEVGNRSTNRDTTSLVVSGDFAYTASQNEFEVFDISDPTSPEQVGESYVSYLGSVWEMAVFGRYVMAVGTGTRGVKVFDVSTPSGPVLLNRFGVTSPGNGVAAAAGFAVIAAGDEGLLVMDMRSPGCISKVGRFLTTGGAIDVVVEGDFAYLSDLHTGFRVIDISNPSAPEAVWIDETHDTVRWLSVSGDRLYASAGNAGLLIFDLGDPRAPMLLGAYTHSGYLQRLTVEGAYAFVAEGRSVRVVNVADPLSPFEVAEVGDDWNVQEMVVSDSHLYVVDGSTGLHIFDITTPNEPVEVSHFEPPGWFSDVAVEEGLAFLTDTSGGLRVIDVGVPADPSELCYGYASLNGEEHSVAISNGRVFASTGKGLYVADLSAPCTPVFLGWCEDENYPDAVSGSFGYDADYERGLVILDISGPFGPAKVDQLERFATNDAIATAGLRAYIAGSNGLRILDATKPASPEEASFFEFPLLREVEVSAGYAYVASDYDGAIHALDVRDPRFPTEVWSDDRIGGHHLDIEVANGLLLAVSSGDGHLFDVSIPTWPYWLSGMSFYRPIVDLEFSGDNVYLSDTDGDLLVVDITTPSSPLLIGDYDDFGGVAIEASENHLYSAQLWGMLVLDVDDPLDPTLESFFPSLSQLTDLTAAGNCVFIVDTEVVRAIDVSVPSAPIEVGSCETTGPATDLTVLGRYLYVTEGWAGFEIFDISGCAGAVPAVSRNVGGRRTPDAP